MITVEQVRQLGAACATPPMGPGYQVFAVFGADCLNQVSGNALLKTLEEPPSRTVIVLVAERLDAVLPTIRSRTQLVLTSLVPETLIAQTLIAGGTAPERANELAQAAGGRIGWALTEADAAQAPLPWPEGDPGRPIEALAMAKALGDLTTADLRATMGARLRARRAQGWDELVALEEAIAGLDAHANPKLVIETLLHRQGEA